MPTDACQYFYECTSCKTLLKPKPGDCCVFCSYGSIACPPIQEQRGCCSASHFGPTLAVEVTPIEHWLELEFGVSALRSHGATEWETDLLFKKPYQLSRTVEANSVGAEFVLDFMFWPKERWGRYLEPSYGYGFDHEHSRSLGLSAGLLIGFP